MANSAIQSAQFGVATESQRGVVNGTDARNLVFGGSALSFRNKLINGDMRIDQRFAGVSTTTVAGTAKYVADRWIAFGTGAGLTAQRINNSGLTGYPYALQLTGAAGNTYASMVQRIEAINCIDLVGKSLTVSFNAALSSGTSLTVELYYINSSANTDNWSAAATTTLTQTVTVSSSLSSRYSVTFSNLPAGAANGMQVAISVAGLGAGVTLTATAFQAEAGSVATPFENRLYQQELMLAQRYYQRNFINRGAVGAYSAAGVSFRLPLHVPLRASTTANQVAGTSLTNALDKIGTGPYTPTSISFPSANQMAIHVDFGGSFTAYQPLALLTDIIEVSAEL